MTCDSLNSCANMMKRLKAFKRRLNEEQRRSLRRFNRFIKAQEKILSITIRLAIITFHELNISNNRNHNASKHTARSSKTSSDSDPAPRTNTINYIYPEILSPLISKPLISFYSSSLMGVKNVR